jgi:hypothetical protein
LAKYAQVGRMKSNDFHLNLILMFNNPVPYKYHMYSYRLLIAVKDEKVMNKSRINVLYKMHKNCRITEKNLTPDILNLTPL